ncbi:MAG: aminotransferase class I/II-fold pyridoxal phosphate-dependent enzyme [Candidatus Omnitrophica bacterium]|nr:aminotransferase class I/II-fold pyridoxal phosphate-dependent enzyme [Candidatus Omnitrophota bacterium]
MKAQARLRGIDVIDLGMGNPDLPTPPHIVAEMRKQIAVPENHRYSRPDGIVEKKLKEAIAAWYYRRFRVSLDPKREVLPLIGSKEGIAHLSLAFLNNDDIAIVPDPAYPVHFNGVIMAGGILYHVPLTPENHYQPNLQALPREVVRRSKFIFLGYPHNPTTQVVDLAFFQQAVRWCRQHKIMLIHDFAYSDIVFDGYRAPSALSVSGSKEVTVEFHTLSKSYNMAGWRIGFVVGNPEILGTLAKTKSYVDFGIFRAVQWSAIKALTGPQDCVHRLVETYRQRRDLFVDGLNEAGWQVAKPKSTFYIWAKIPLKFSALTSLEFATLLMQEAGVVVSPGTGFGEYGEGFVRFALVDQASRLKTAASRIGQVLRMHD